MGLCQGFDADGGSDALLWLESQGDYKLHACDEDMSDDGGMEIALQQVLRFLRRRVADAKALRIRSFCTNQKRQTITRWRTSYLPSPQRIPFRLTKNHEPDRIGKRQKLTD